MVYKRERKEKRLFTYCMTRAFRADESTLTVFRILFEISLFLCCGVQALPAVDQRQILTKAGICPLWRLLKSSSPCLLVCGQVFCKRNAVTPQLRVQVPPFPKHHSWLLNKSPAHSSAAAGEKAQEKGEHKFCTGSPVRMMLKSKSRCGCAERRLWCGENGALWSVFVSGDQARAGSSMVCIDVHYSNFRALF